VFHCDRPVALTSSVTVSTLGASTTAMVRWPGSRWSGPVRNVMPASAARVGSAWVRP
jgi:hypothetical protein